MNFLKRKKKYLNSCHSNKTIKPLCCSGRLRLSINPRTVKMRIILVRHSKYEISIKKYRRAAQTALRKHFYLLRQKPLTVQSYAYSGFFLVCVCLSKSVSLSKRLFRQAEPLCCSGRLFVKIFTVSLT